MFKRLAYGDGHGHGHGHRPDTRTSGVRRQIPGTRSCLLRPDCSGRLLLLPYSTKMPSTPHFETRTCPCRSSHYGGTCEQSTYSIRLVLLRTEHCPTGQYHIINACLSVIPDRPRSRSYEPALTCKCKHRGRSELFRCILGWILGWICPRV